MSNLYPQISNSTTGIRSSNNQVYVQGGSGTGTNQVYYVQSGQHVVSVNNSTQVPTSITLPASYAATPTNNVIYMPQRPTQFPQTPSQPPQLSNKLAPIIQNQPPYSNINNPPPILQQSQAQPITQVIPPQTLPPSQVPPIPRRESKSIFEKVADKSLFEKVAKKNFR